VLHIARLLAAGSQVKIYQSEFFNSETTDDVRQLATHLGAELNEIRGTGERETSLSEMRRAMFATRPRVAFFCGGMDGLDEEFAIAGEQAEARYLFVDPGDEPRCWLGLVAIDPGAASPSISLYGRAYGSLVLKAVETSGVSGPQAMGPYEQVMFKPADTSPQRDQDL